MERQNYLGIYFGKDKATVVCLGLTGREKVLQGCFSVSIDSQQQNHHTLASLIAQGCAQRKLHFSEVALAMDCAMFMQHDVHSDLSDPKQIAATVRFETEEVLATDITNLAIAYQINSSDNEGSDLTVFTAERQILSDILISLQNNNIDPVTLEPDIVCLSRFIRHNMPSSQTQNQKTLFGILSENRGYFVGLSESQQSYLMRTFLISPKQGRQELLQRHALTTIGIAEAVNAVDCLRIYDSTAAIDCEQIASKVGIEVEALDLTASAGPSGAGSMELHPQAEADCGNPVDFVIACGAVLVHADKAKIIDFRNDFMPYQGKKVRLHKALKFLSVSVTILLLAVGLFGQIKLLLKNKDRGKLWQKSAKQYSVVMPGQQLPEDWSGLVKKLAGEARSLKSVSAGQSSITGKESTSAKLTLILEAFNKCAKETNLNVNTITISEKNVIIFGSTPRPANTEQFFDTLRKTGLKILDPSYQPKAGAHTFRINVEPQQQ